MTNSDHGMKADSGEAEVGQPLQLIGDARQLHQSDTLPTYVVGVGASAGGLEALEALFDELPADTGMAFVVVQHLSPDFKSLMDELIRRHTEMAVFRVENGMEVQRNAIYLIPAGKEMIIAQGKLLLTDKDPDEALTLPIDHFFRSLAHDCGERAIAVVLSGSGSDGSRGVREVSEMGGKVITQDAATAAFDSMPNSSIETGVVDIVAAPDEIAAELLRVVNHPLQTAVDALEDSDIPEDGIKQILKVLRDNYGIDFTYYKPATVMRRIERRLLLNRSTDLAGYVDNITGDTNELNLLYKDLLIGVTQFFRDPAAFKLLEENILPEILLRISATQEVRIWVAGCATGEEAYSIAILLHERLVNMNRPINARIFATDVHPTSLDVASSGVYTESSIAHISAARLERYFTRVREGYKISQELRNMVVFAPHNLIKDAPFTRLDLITCRNMMIYLQPLAQKKVLSLFHFALKTGSTLFLGPSESTGELSDEFEVVDAQWRFYRKRRDIRLPPVLRLPNSGGPNTAKSRESAGCSGKAFPIRQARSMPFGSDRELAGLYDALLEELMPAALVINEHNELVHSFGNVGDLLRIPTGRASASALDMLPPDLRTVVIGAMQQAVKTGKTIGYNQVCVETAKGVCDVRVTIKPIIQRATNCSYTLIGLEQPDGNAGEQPSLTAGVDTPLDIDDIARQRIEVLETELRHSRENLQATIEELESSNEEMQATNEELVASNEELQSTNEELHSVNEELYTVNAEYQKKIGELTELTHDIDNLLNSTDVHTLFLDENLCIRKFTPQMGAEFNLIPSDVGRRIDGFKHNIPCENLMEKLAEVIENGKRYDEEVRAPDGDHFLLRILCYRGETNRSGVVLTLVDVTDSREAETRFRGTFENAAVGMAHVDLTGRWLRVNHRLCDILGYTPEMLKMKTFQEVTFVEDLEVDLYEFAALKRGEVERYSIEKRYIRNDNSLVWISLTVSLQRDEAGDPLYAITIVQDISQRKDFENQLSEAVKQRDQFLAMLSHELRNPLSAIANASVLLDRLAGDDQDSAKARNVIRRQSDRVAGLLEDLLDVSRVTQGKIPLQKRIVDLNDLVRESLESVSSLLNSHHHKVESKLAEDALWIDADSGRILQVLDNLLTNAAKYTPDGGLITVSTTIDAEHDAQTPEWVVVQVSDNGFGLSQVLIASVFDMFIQSDVTLDRSEGGMGVGLTLVRSLVGLHGGTIKASSQGLGHGSQFTVRLPMVVPPVRVDRARKRSESATTGTLPRILLVEDNADTRDMLRAILELDGYEVDTARDGLEGFNRLVDEPFDLALIDIGLPKMDGYEVASRCRRELKDAAPRMIALTGYGQESDVARAKEAGFHEHIVKPVDSDKLNRVLDEARKPK